VIRAGKGLCVAGCLLGLALTGGACLAAEQAVAPDGATAISAERGQREAGEPVLVETRSAEPAAIPVAAEVLLNGIAAEPLGLAPDAALPVELGSFADSLREVDQQAPLQSGEGQVEAICGRLGQWQGAARDIRRAPLLEMTQMNFDTWRAGTAALVDSVQQLGGACERRDGPAVVQGYLAMRKAFRHLLRVRR